MGLLPESSCLFHVKIANVYIAHILYCAIMNYAVFALIIVLVHNTFCFAQDKALDVVHEAVKNVASAPGSTINLLKKATNDAKIFFFQDDPIFSECFSVPNAFCVGGTSKVITAAGVPPGLFGWWKFDEIYPIDHSGHGNHMHKTVRAGPGLFGHGASGAFSEYESGVVGSSESLNSDKFTVAFWIYLLENSTGSFRFIFGKGIDIDQTPTILLYPGSRRLSVRVTTSMFRQDGLSSIGTIPLRRWTHVAVTGYDSKLKIYINGVKDNEITMKSKITQNYYGITVGATFVKRGFEGYMDDLRYYTRALTGSEVASFTSPGLTGIIDRDLISIGCDSCDYDTAIAGDVCPSTYQLCTLEQLFEGGLHIARVNGWIAGRSDIWHLNTNLRDVTTGEKRLAICCKKLSEIPQISENSEIVSEIEM